VIEARGIQVSRRAGNLSTVTADVPLLVLSKRKGSVHVLDATRKRRAGVLLEDGRYGDVQ
jgi:hypothetical protein